MFTNDVLEVKHLMTIRYLGLLVSVDEFYCYTTPSAVENPDGGCVIKRIVYYKTLYPTADGAKSRRRG